MGRRLRIVLNGTKQDRKDTKMNNKEIQAYNTDVETQKNELLSEIRNVLNTAKHNIVREVNSQIVHAYWQIGKYIVEYEQGGAQRAEYDKNLINDLAHQLQSEFGTGFNATNLRYMRQFYQEFPIYHTVCDKLNWSHIRLVIKVKDAAAREFYINECISEQWSVRQLERQINTMYYERLLSSKDKDAVRSEIQQSTPKTLEPKEIIRDPYVLEFLGISQGEHFLESDLEQALISKLQHFLLELGKGFTFVARQKRISFDNEHYYIDLVFYNILARCYVLIDLKADRLTHQDLGQMQMYVNYYTRELMNPGDNPPIGIVLCADKNDSVVEYTLPEGENQIYAAKYMTYMPSKEELKQLIAQ